ncbi:MAG: M60 family metallopeptidase [Bacteroidaceae bacterium]|nr:M60 family metallopeptidase [Bacteroidaceae bacterium]
MKKLFNTLFIMLASISLMQAQSIPVDSAIYRLVNAYRTNAVMTEDISAHNIYCTAKGDSNSYNQLWMFIKNGTGWNIQNVFTGQYIQNQSETYALFTTASTPKMLYVSENSTIAGNYNIVNSNGGNWGMHCDAAYDVVPWYSGSNTAGGSEWLFEKVEMTKEELNAARQRYNEFNNTLTNQEAIKNAYTQIFEDELCTVLKSEYQAMSDEALSEALSSCGSTLVNAAIKIKNNAWEKREKEFRIHTYEPYSDPEYWAKKLNIRIYTWLNNPTGIYANTCDVVYVFVGKDIKEGSTLKIDAVTGNGNSGTRTELKKGMNIIPVSRDAQSLFVLYTADTSGEYLIADFDSIPIHIEGGVVNGYWDKTRHNDADWVDITRNHATHDYITVKGDNHTFFMKLDAITASNCCPNTISDAIGWWDNMSMWQQQIMGMEDYRPSRFNNKQCAVTTSSGYQSAGNYTTNYAENYINNLLPYERMMSNGDNAWGPAHENGHVHQYAINMVACSEVSNNLFSNLTLYKLGKYMSRGGKVSDIKDAYEQSIAWPKRDGGLTLRMYWQLYLYYHAAGNNPDFYPTLFKLLREEPMKKTSGGTLNYGRYDLLHFAEKCCQAAGEDMTDFFEAWGFFVPMSRAEFDDYGTYILTSTQAMIDTTKARIAKYPKKAGGIQFIEDRVRHELRTDGGSGNKLVNGVAVGEGGDVGHYTSFVPDSMNVVANGYIYSKAGKTINISKGSGAVGFKVYDADNRLLSFSNEYSIELSDESAVKELFIVAVAANGKETIVNSKNNGTEEEQLEALNEALVSAQNIIKFKDSGNRYVGYYYERVLQQLISLTDSAKSAIADKDQSVHKYGEWATLIDKEINFILSQDDIKVKIQSGNSYKLENILYPGYTMYYNSGTVVCKSGTSMPKARNFKFTSTKKENEYYISSSGNYIDYVATSTLTKASTSSQSKAVKFTVGEAGEGIFYVCKTGENMNSLHCDASKNVVGWSTSADASHWKIIATELTKENQDIASLNTLISEATSIYNIIVDTTKTEGISFKEGVEVVSATLAIDVESMMAIVTESNNIIEKKYYECCPELIESLSAAIETVKAGYSVGTGINGILYDGKKSKIYDINGHKIDEITESGIYIIDGKKVFLE